jgi:hypothetical protein
VHSSLITGAVIAGLITLVGWLALPGLVESRVRARLQQRGIEYRADSVHVGVFGVAFAGLELRVAGSGRPFLRAARLEVHGTPSSAAGSGLAGLERIELEGAEIELSAEDIRTLRSTRRSASNPSAKTSDSGPTKLPELELRDAKLTLRDKAGALAGADKLVATLSDGAWKLAAQSLFVGDKSSDLAAMRALSAQGSLEGALPVLRLVVAESGALTWGAAKSEPEQSSTLDRLRGFRRALAGEEGGDTQVQPQTSRAGHAWLAPEAHIELRQMRVDELSSSGALAPILEKLSASIDAKGPDTLRAQGSGAAPSSGQVSWDLTVVPKELRVEGKVVLKDVALALFGPVLPPLPFAELERTRLSADLELTGRGLESVAVKGSLSVRDLQFASEGLARFPVGPFSIDSKGEGTWTPARRELSNVKAQIGSAGVNVGLSGVLAWPRDGYHVDFLAELPKSKCSQVLGAVPMGLLDELSSVELGGTLGGKLMVHVDSADLDATKVDFDIQDACTFGSLPELLNLGRFQRLFVHQVLEPDGTLFEMETGPGTPNWTPIEYVSPFFIQAVVSHEDGRFFGHRGFAEPEIGVALARNLKARAFRFGASTITMQLVKNVFLHRDKLLARKVQEAFIVWWLEQQWDKRRILELYFNVIEYGPAIYGIRNASVHYFGVLPMDLTPAQAAFLACILPSPKSSHVHYEKGALSSSAKNRITNLLKHMQSRGRIDADALAYGLEELEHFRFYDPSQPPPVPPQIRGTAQKPPFNTLDNVIDPWESFGPSVGPVESGHFGP